MLPENVSLLLVCFTGDSTDEAVEWDDLLATNFDNGVEATRFAI